MRVSYQSGLPRSQGHSYHTQNKCISLLGRALVLLKSARGYIYLEMEVLESIPRLDICCSYYPEFESERSSKLEQKQLFT